MNKKVYKIKINMYEFQTSQKKLSFQYAREVGGGGRLNKSLPAYAFGGFFFLQKLKNSGAQVIFVDKILISPFRQANL